MTKKQKAMLGIGALLVVAGGATGAYAFYSAAEATVTDENASGMVGDAEQLQPLVLKAVVPPVKLGKSDYVTYQVSNPNANQPVHLNTVTAGTVKVDAAHAACPAESFTLTDFNSYGAQDIPARTTGVTVGDEILHYNNLSVAQNACIGATLTVTFSTN